MDITTLFQVLSSALVILILGFVWYHPRVFGTLWMRLVNLSPEMVERGRRRSLQFMSAAFLCGVVLASAVRIVADAFPVFSVVDTLTLALLLWFGFVFPVALVEAIWEERPPKLFLINALYWLAALILTSFIMYL